MSMRLALPALVRSLLIAAVAAMVVLLLLFSRAFGYVNHQVASNEIAVKLHAGQVIDVVGPGVYTDLTPFAAIDNISIAAVHFTMFDGEVLTKDRQRLGVVINGDILRPISREEVINFYVRYRSLALSDAALLDIVAKEVPASEGRPAFSQGLASQAAKVCIGEKTFEEAVIGSTRDDVALCISNELTNLARNYGFTILNVVVPNYVLTTAQQQQLDAATEARLAALTAAAQAEQAIQEANRELAKQQGTIRVEQGRIQEKAKQDAITADLQRAALEKQREVIAAEKANQLFAAQQDIEINRQQALAKAELAKAENAALAARAAIYEANPNFARLTQAEAVAAAYKQADKVIVPAGTNPIVLVGDTTPVVPLPAPTPAPQAGG